MKYLVIQICAKLQNYAKLYFFGTYSPSNSAFWHQSRVDNTQGVKEEPIMTIPIKIAWQISLTSRAHAVCLSGESVLPKLAWDTSRRLRNWTRFRQIDQMNLPEIEF